MTDDLQYPDAYLRQILREEARLLARLEAQAGRLLARFQRKAAEGNPL